MENSAMLETLDQVPWEELEHAYGSAEDIPPLILALIDDDPNVQKRAQEFLDMGVFHQESIYTVTPYVARFLVELVQYEELPSRGWMFYLLCRLIYRAAAILAAPETQPDDDHQDSWMDMTRGELRAWEREIAQQIHGEIAPHVERFYAALDSPDPAVRLSVPTMLLLHKDQLPNLQADLHRCFLSESDEKLRVVLGFCLGYLADFDKQAALSIFESEIEAAIVRLAVGFGIITRFKENTSSEALQRFAALLEVEPEALNKLEDIFQDWLQSFTDRRMLDILLWLSPTQRLLFVPLLLTIYAQLPPTKDPSIRIGDAYYLQSIIGLAFPDLPLPPDTTIHDLNETQKSIFAAIQTFRIPQMIAGNSWNVTGSNDFRSILGMYVTSEADFLDFMAGKRTASRIPKKST